MAPKDVAGVFSRYFIVGFFLPAFFVLLVLSQALTSDFLPEIYERYSDATRVLVIGGAGLLLGLLLLGLNWQIYRLIEGYPLLERRERWYLSGLTNALLNRQQKTFDALRAIRDSATAPEDKRSNAAWKLDREFPEVDGSILPTRFGNAVRAFEVHAYKRWGLDSIAVWPRIDMLLSERQAELLADAKSEVAFFVNSSLLAFLAGLVLLVDQVINKSLENLALAAYLAPFLLAYLMYRGAVGAALRWGTAVRAATDVQRFTLYRHLGIGLPDSFTRERDRIGPAVNRALLYGNPIPDDLIADESQAERGAPDA